MEKVKEKNRIREVKLLGCLLRFESDKDDEYLDRVVNKVREKVDEIARLSGDLPVNKLLLYALLSLADEHVQLLEESRMMKQEIKNWIKNIKSLLKEFHLRGSKIS